MSTSNAPVDGSSSAAASASTSSPAPPFHRVTLPSGHEYRFELDLVTAASGKDGDAPVAATAAGAGSVAVRALQPGARIMGEPLPVGAWYPLMLGARSCVVSASTRGEEITLEWTREPTAGAYVSSASTWPGVRNVHLALEAERIRARRRRAGSTKNGAGGGAAGGPRVLVLGSPSSGKSTTVKTLLNLALGGGMGWGLGVVGLDPGESPHLLPGSLSLSHPHAPVPSHHPLHPLGAAPTTAAPATLGAGVLTLGYYLGATSLAGAAAGATAKTALFKRIVRAMADAWDRRTQVDAIADASGLIVDTPSEMCVPRTGGGERYPLVVEVVEAFKISLVLVLGAEKLTVEMRRLLGSRGVQVLSLEKSSGCVDLDAAYRSGVRALQTRAYFYGEPALPKELAELPGRIVAREGALHPQNFTVSWDDLEIYRVGEELAAPSSALPIGQQAAASPTRLTRVDPTAPPSIHRLHNAVLGLVPVSDDDRRADVDPDDGDDDDEVAWEEHVAWREVAGFVVITRVDVAKRRYELLTPSPGKLPSRVAIAGSVEWNEDDM